MEAAAIAKCSRIGTAGKGATLAPADVDALIRLGNSPVSNARIAAAFCDAVGKAGECFENPSLLGEAAIQAVISAMDTYAIDVDVQSKGCVALANLSWVEANKATLSALGALDHINRAWNVVDGDPQGQYNAVFAILFLTTSTTIAPILDAGWLERILTSMDRQVANAEYQDICCQTLHGFASEPAGKAALLAEPRSIPYLERARDNHPTHDDLQRSSRLAVEAILEPPAITECKRIGDLGHGSTLSLADVGALIRTGTNGAADAAVSAAFCYAVSSASFNGTPARDNAIHLGESAINAVLAAMDAHPADANVQSKGCRALWNITFEVDANKVLSVAAGAVARIDRAWDVIGDHNIPGILWGVEPGRFLAVGAIGSLTTAVSFQPILDAGWLNRVLAWMEDHQGSYQYQYACCQTLSAFASQPTGKAAVLADARSVPYLQRARNTHPDSPSVQRFSKSALDTIAA